MFYESRVLKLAVAFALIVMLFGACAFPFQGVETPNLTDISNKLNYNEISRQAFIGGSLLYNPRQVSVGHLYPGVNIAVRLGKVDKEEAVPGQVAYIDRRNDASYGYITIETIDEKQVTFTYTRYAVAGQDKFSSVCSVYLNESVDINGDNIVDIHYTVPPQKRPGLEKAFYLTFVSSQEKLNTSMFAVLPEQYSRGAYPNGLIGINPDGRFVVAKYEHEKSSARSAVKGIVYGDYVLDYTTGMYQKVTGSGKYTTARSVDDSDLTDIGTIRERDVYFVPEEFNEILSAKALFDALPETIRGQYSPENFSNETLVPILNMILENYDLIESVVAVRDVGMTESEITEIKNGIHQIPLTELLMLNRIFLSKVFPELCPDTINSPDGIGYILPLLYCEIRGDVEAEGNDEDVARGIALTHDNYVSQKNAILETWKSYVTFESSVGLNIPYPQFGSGTTNGGHDKVTFGIKGIIDNAWGSHIHFELRAAALLEIEYGNATISKTLQSTSLLGGPKTIINITGAAFTLGPVYISLNCPIEFDILLSANGYVNYKMPVSVCVTALVGARVWAGVNYGIKWIPAWFISVPSFYIDTYSGKDLITEFAFYAGPTDKSNAIVDINPDDIFEDPFGFYDDMGLALTDAAASITVTPKLTFNPRVSAWNLLHAGISMATGLNGNFNVSVHPNAVELIAQNRLPIKGTASLNYFASISAACSIDVRFDFLFIHINQNFPIGSFPLWNYNRELAKTTVF